MSKIDEIKEILNTLRLFISLGVGIIVLLTGALIDKEQKSQIDIYFWIGSIVDLLLMLGLIFIAKAIKKNTETIKDL